MQLYLLMPFIVILYNKVGLKLMTSIMSVALVGGIILNFFIAKHYKIQAGIFTLSNGAYLYSGFLNKPYCKLHVYALGVLSAMLYMEITTYRALLRQ